MEEYNSSYDTEQSGDDGEEYNSSYDTEHSGDDGEEYFLEELTRSWKESFERSTFASLSSTEKTTEITQGQLIYQSNGKAKFVCRECSNQWTSLNSIVKFTYSLPGLRTGCVMFELPYGQQCKRCDGNFELPDFPDSERIRILNKLCLKVQEKFYGRDVNHHYSKPSGSNMTSDHDRSRCQACQQGTCKSQQNFSQPSHRNGRKTGRGYTQVKRRSVKWIFDEKNAFMRNLAQIELENQKKQEELKRQQEIAKQREVMRQQQEELKRQQEIAKQREVRRQQQEELKRQQDEQREETKQQQGGCILL